MSAVQGKRPGNAPTVKGAMPLRRLVAGEKLDPVILTGLNDILESVWTEVGPAFVGQPQDSIDDARAVIAKCLLYHARNGHRDPSTLKALALQALAGAYPQLHL